MDVSSGRRRRWSEADKGRIVAESFERGVRASDVARRHDISPQQLFQWRRRARGGSLVVPVDDGFTFAEVEIERVTEPARPGACGLEIMVGEVCLRVEPTTDLGLVGRVLTLVRGRAI